MNFANVCIESLCQFSLTFERVYDFFFEKEGGRKARIFLVYICARNMFFVRTLRGQDEVANLEAGCVAVFAQR